MTSRVDELLQRQRYIVAQIADLRAAHAAEELDVARLENLSLTRILASLRGARDDKVAQERAESDAARYRVLDAESRLDAVRREYETTRAQLKEMASAPTAYDTVLAEKERRLAESGDPRGRRLLTLAEERGRLTDEVRELAEATEAAQTTGQALDRLSRTLDSASGWSTYDTFFGGGLLSSSIKHARLDEAAAQAAHADQCLVLLRTELADVEDAPQRGLSIPVDGMTRFLDIWFDNIFTDLAVRERILKASSRVAGCARRVRTLLNGLERRLDEAQRRLVSINNERLDLVTRR